MVKDIEKISGVYIIGKIARSKRTGQKAIIVGGLKVDSDINCLVLLQKTGEFEIAVPETLEYFIRPKPLLMVPINVDLWTPVKSLISGERGVIVGNSFNGTVYVNYDGKENETIVSVYDLSLFNPPEELANPLKCGLGKGKRCCIFLQCDDPKRGPFTCLRYKPQRTERLADTLIAQRNPKPPYPNCYLTPKKIQPQLPLAILTK
ncbi:MAG: hypothetical protein ABH919_03595 [bacterium]